MYIFVALTYVLSALLRSHMLPYGGDFSNSFRFYWVSFWGCAFWLEVFSFHKINKYITALVVFVCLVGWEYVSNGAYDVLDTLVYVVVIVTFLLFRKS